MKLSSAETSTLGRLMAKAAAPELVKKVSKGTAKPVAKKAIKKPKK